MSAAGAIRAREPDRRVLPAVWKLLRLRVRLALNRIRHGRGRARVGAVLLALLLAAFAAGLLLLSWLLLGFLRSPDLAEAISVDPAQIIAAVPVLVLTGLFLAIVLTSFGGLLQALYLTGDMDFLMASPVPIRAVFIAKLVQSVAPVLGLVSLFGLPVLFGLGLSGGYNPLYYPLLLVMMVALSLAASGIASLLVMLVVRVVPARRAAEIIAFVGAIVAVSLSQVGNVLNTLRGDEAHPAEPDLGGIAVGASTPWLPLNWAGRGLVDLGEGRWLSGLGLTALTIGIALLVFWVAVRTAERWYYTGWAGLQVVARKPKPKPNRAPASDAGGTAVPARAAVTAPAASGRSPLARWVPQPVLALVRRDALLLRRDLRNLSQLVTPLIFGVVYTVVLFGGRSSPGDDAPDVLRRLFAYSNVGMTLFVGWQLLTPLGVTSFSREGRSYWLVKASPVGSGQMLVAKFIVAYVPAVVIALVFNLVIGALRGLSPIETAYSLIASMLCLAGMAGILLAFGVVGARFDWSDPRRMAGGTMGCLGQFVAMVFTVIAFGLFIGPVAIAAWLRLPDADGFLAGLVLGGVAALAAAVGPLVWVRGRVARLDESA